MISVNIHLRGAPHGDCKLINRTSNHLHVVFSDFARCLGQSGDTPREMKEGRNDDLVADEAS